MRSNATTVEEYISELPAERVDAFLKIRLVVLDNLPKGFEEVMSYSMPSYVVPHSLYPAGYHCKPDEPLPYMSLASQKGFIGVYHLGIYANDKIMDWFTSEYSRVCRYKLDMGKSCIRLKKMDDIPYELIGELTGKITVDQWIDFYERSIKK